MLEGGVGGGANGEAHPAPWYVISKTLDWCKTGSGSGTGRYNVQATTTRPHKRKPPRRQGARPRRKRARAAARGRKGINADHKVHKLSSKRRADLLSSRFALSLKGGRACGCAMPNHDRHRSRRWFGTKLTVLGTTPCAQLLRGVAVVCARTAYVGRSILYLQLRLY